MLSEALTDAQIEQLAARLSANRNPGALTLEAVDGLFCALIAAPTLVTPSVYLPVILGSDASGSPVFADRTDATETLSLLTRYWNSIAEDFRSGDQLHLPYIEEPGTDHILGRDWARGYLKGTRLAPEGWSRLFQDEQEGLSLMIPVVAGEVDPLWPPEPLSVERSDEILKDMIAGAARAYRYFQADRERGTGRLSASSFQGPVVRAAPKVGRNETCPCGSGKKFKHCCGAGPRGSVH
jgi:uncharacterized protein